MFALLILALVLCAHVINAIPEAHGLRAGVFVNSTVTDEIIESTATQYGYDVSAALSSSSASCLNSNGYIFAVPRGYRSTGAVDTAVCNTIKTAKTAGAKVRDVYLFPCKLC